MEVISDLMEPIHFMESEENMALLEKQRQCMEQLREEHQQLVESATQAQEEDPDGEEYEELLQVRKNNS